MLWTLLACLLFCGCVQTTYKVDTSKDMLLPDERKSIIYFIRGKHMIGSGVDYDVKDGTEKIGTLKNGSYFIYKILPGKHTFVVPAFSNASLTVDIDYPKTYFIEFSVTMFGTNLEEIEELVAIERMEKLIRIKHK
ncbi:MAG: DUF2846 domain-containing protein [Desulfovibrio sp.]|jgi:hypothetical protein|nr:DUF2846 domain-containing protein [Desulfovibrio sp.]